MSTEISTQTKKKKHFEIVEGSNYKLIDVYKEEYVVEYDQFLNILKSIQEGKEFVTVNKEILSRSKIYKIKPTLEKTEKEKNIKLDPSFGIN